MRNDLVEAERVRSIVGGFYSVYNELGFGFLEPVYCRALELELSDRGHSVAREVSVAIRYKGRLIGRQRMDLIVDDRIIVEVKSTERLAGVAARQLLNYLRASSYKVGMLLGFGPQPKFWRYVHSRKGLVEIDTGQPR
jgi:GxxExxY protein